MSAVTATTGHSDRTVVMHFRFRGQTRFVRIGIDDAELAAARRLDTSRVFSSMAPVRAAYLRMLVAEQSRSRTVAVIAVQLRGYRDLLGLDSDEYVELIARFVQEIPYGGADNETKLPVEVVSEGRGVCDDRSILLAALLVHEGYDTAVWAFDSQAHAAVGVKCLGPGMLASGYAFVETTQPAFVGQGDGAFVSRASWRRTPQLVRVGGRGVYRADLEAAFITRQLERARLIAHAPVQYARYVRTGPVHLRPVYESAAARQAGAHEWASRLGGSFDDRAQLYALLTEAAGR